MYVVNLCHCPNCGCPIEGRMFGVCSYLGPGLVECWKCHGPVDLGRHEWADMSSGSRFWFGLVTGLYVVMLGIITGNFLDGAWQLWTGQPTIGNLRFESLQFQYGAGVGGVTALALQLYRITASRRRSRVTPGVIVRPKLYGLDLNLQFKCLLALVALWGIAKIKYELRL
jgi:hypothetical protein